MPTWLSLVTGRQDEILQIGQGWKYFTLLGKPFTHLYMIESSKTKPRLGATILIILGITLQRKIGEASLFRHCPAQFF
jgi:hypothetical protein